ncbi:MAG: DUF502 domain-containing protein [Phycisphaerales bacterium]|nr:MAG: DUF502 domain-containing protein [Phycisphaerales bacterium]
MADPSARTFTSDFKRFFLRGLVVLLPSVLTLWIVVKAYQFVDTTFAEPINRGVRLALTSTAKVYEPLRDIFDPTEEMVAQEMANVPENDIRNLAEERLRGLTPEERTEEVLAEAMERARATKRAEITARLRTTKVKANVDAWWAEHWAMDLIGLAVAIVVVYIAGRLLGGFVGRRTYRKIEDFVVQLPIFKQVYPYIKQVVDFLFSDDQPIKFNRVVAVEYPRKGIWSIGFATGSPMRDLQARAGDVMTVFVPSSPTPFTGYTIAVPREDVIEMPISVEEAIRFAVSGGVLVPDHQATADKMDQGLEETERPMASGLIPIVPRPDQTPSHPTEPEEPADNGPKENEDAD